MGIIRAFLEEGFILRPDDIQDMTIPQINLYAKTLQEESEREAMNRKLRKMD
jgi:hypothetical protein